jgi:APA family basic amino acid/polyamine antiporter
MAEDGYFHSSFTKLDANYRTPVQAIVLTSAICAGLAFFSVPKLIAVYMWLRVATSVLTLLSVWRLRRTRPDMPRGFRIPGGEFGVAAVVLVPLFLFAWLLINSDPAGLLWGPVFLLLGPIAAALMLRRGSRVAPPLSGVR